MKKTTLFFSKGLRTILEGGGTVQLSVPLKNALAFYNHVVYHLLTPHSGITIEIMERHRAHEWYGDLKTMERFKQASREAQRIEAVLTMAPSHAVRLEFKAYRRSERAPYKTAFWIFTKDGAFGPTGDRG